MAKCVRLNNNEIVRLGDMEACAVVTQGGGEYVNRDMWRKANARQAANKKRIKKIRKPHSKKRHPSN